MRSRHGPIECREVLERLYAYLDGELTAPRERAVRDHLAVCAHCFKHFHFEGAFLKFLEARTRAQHASPELKRRILEALIDENSNPS